ncbi:hypothetical protein GALL_455790 [mine drainage metagenome]|uniref:Scramblase n=1 Tax=mine drainage metagenome TaxID=410659 RepID=A0A1J5PYA2_9ZZZZ
MSAQEQAWDGLRRFVVTQRFTMMVNRYEIRALATDGGEGPVLAVAQQKRMAFKDQVTFYADDARTIPVFSFRARQAIDLGATYDVLDAAGTPIGLFRKDFAASLLRSTWHLEAGAVSAVGQERNALVAILRRVTDAIPLAVHIDFTDPQGRPVMSSVRTWGLRDRYVIEVPDVRLDSRVAAAMAVALDALQGR